MTRRISTSMVAAITISFLSLLSSPVLLAQTMPSSKIGNTKIGNTETRQLERGPEIPERMFEISVPSINGQVSWHDVATELADQLRLDRSSVEQMLPAGTIDLRSGTVMLTLLTINLAFGDAVSFTIEQDAVGSEALQVRCRRSFFAASSLTKSSRSAAIVLDDDWKLRTTSNPMLIFIHGMNSDSESFDPMREHFRILGFATGAADYDYRQSIKHSAAQLSIALQQAFPDATQVPSLCLIGHSMGGLVARELTESPKVSNGIDPERIKQLITIASPHQGSNWATLPPMSDMFTGEGLDEDDLMGIILHQPSADGIADLSPGSNFLRGLNSRDRRDDVRYTAIIGTVSPVSEAEMKGLQDTLRSLDQDGSFLRLIRPRIEPLLDSFDELTTGRGDGIVSVESAKFPGIEDQIKIPVSHFDMIPRAAGQDGQQVWNAIARCLKQ